MRHLVFIFSLIFVGVSTAGELPWIGVSLDQASSESRKETGLIHGVGFEVSKVITGGPLASAGGKEGDLWWKFDGQILVNKSQMVVLLRTKSPGDEVEVEVYRGGLLDKLSVKLGLRKRSGTYPVSFKHEKSNVSRVLCKREQIARVSVDGSDLSLEQEDEKWRFKVVENGTEVLSVLLSKKRLVGEIPVKWHVSFMILKQTLGNSDQQTKSSSQKRVRYVPREKSPEK